ncbi:MAG: DUF1566 domain-containing protein [Deltaproteobacteria bacterium]|nr:DUF1566 domain-containing protein [Deltaproteobacteria bacterium]
MRSLYSSLIAMVAFVVFASMAAAADGHPAWDKQINNPGRFKKLGQFGNAAVFDKETGLVWEQSPDTNTRNWVSALTHCYQRLVGGRKGWRLPTIEELASLVDPNNPGGDPDLPPGHPFANVQSSFYWSATTFAVSSSNAWGVYFVDGFVGDSGKGFDGFVWCVRGGQGIDGVQ